MGRSSKPRKAYRGKGVVKARQARIPPWSLDASFGPLEAILHHVERHGTLDVSEAGYLTYFMAAHGRTYNVVALLEGYAAIFDVARIRDPRCPLAEPLARAGARLDEGQIGADDIADALRCVAALRAYAAGLSPMALHDIIVTTEIKYQLQELEESGES